MVSQNKGGSLYKRLVSRVEEQIENGELSLGDKLPSENELAEANNVSRVTVRQALKLLTEMGLVETRRGIGTFVAAEPNVDTFQERVSDFTKNFEENCSQIMQAKMLIEPDIARYVAENATYEGIRKMDNLFIAMNKAVTKNDYIQFCADFHLSIIESLKNQFLLGFYKNLEEIEKMYLIELVLPSNISKKIIKEDLEMNGKILQAIKERKQKKAYLYTLERLEVVYDNYKNFLDYSDNDNILI